MVLVTICSDFGAQEKKWCHCFHFYPFYLPRSDGTECHDLRFFFFFFFLMLSFKPDFLLSSFRLFSSSSLSVIRVVSSAYLRLLIFSLAILIPASDSSNLAFCMMNSAYKLKKQSDSQYIALMYSIPNFEPVICSMSFPCKGE